MTADLKNLEKKEISANTKYPKSPINKELLLVLL